MDTSKIRLDEPIIIPRKKAQKNKHKKSLSKQSYKVKKETIGIIYKDYVSNPYGDFSDERKQVHVKTVMKSFKKKMLRSSRSKKNFSRMSFAAVYKGRGHVKTCTKCKVERGITDFDIHKGTIRRSYCRFCRRTMNKEAYLRRKNDNL